MDLLGLLGPHFPSDVTLVLRSGAEVKAHKSVLAGGSAYFIGCSRVASTSETEVDRVYLDDHNPDTIGSLVHAIYGGVIPPLALYFGGSTPEELGRLLEAVDYFQCDQLTTAIMRILLEGSTSYCGVFAIVARRPAIGLALQKATPAQVRANCDMIVDICSPGLENLLTVPELRAYLQSHGCIGHGFFWRVRKQDADGNEA